MSEQLPPDPEAIEHWEKMVKNQPSKSALPPLTGGTQWALWIVIIAVVLAILGLLAQAL
ncbi:MAG: hypothetical protein OHK0046_40970 [Anaerolineae bacterium]